jgi:hypothetical protein
MWCKATLVVSTLLLAVHALADPVPARAGLRDCIARAPDAAAVLACEVNEQAALKVRIKQSTAAIRSRLDARQRQLFERNSGAWQAFCDSETAMIGLTLDLRGDGLGTALRPGAITRLYEERERQLREHLHNLKATRGPLPPRP